MVRAWFRRPFRMRWLAVGGPLFVFGCSYLHSEQKSDYDPRMAPPLSTTASAIPPMIGKSGATSPAALPAVQTVGFQEAIPGHLPATVSTAAAGVHHKLSVNLETVLRLTEAQNCQIALARKRVEEAAAAECNGHSGPVAQLLLHTPTGGSEEGFSFGSGRYAAEAKTWQRRAELARVTNETLLDAGITYFDLLTARSGESIGNEIGKYQESLLRRAEDLAKSDRSAAVLVESLRAETSGRRAVLAKLHQQGDAAIAKLGYLLNLPPETPIIPLDASLEPFDLVDASRPASVLVELAQSEGPGIHEVSGLLATIEQAISSVHPCLARLPRVARQLQLAQFKLEETRLALEDLRGKLAAGVIEAREAIHSGRGQITDSVELIRHSAETYRLSDLRLKQNAPGASTNDVSISIRGLELAHLTHITGVAAYDKAQLRLLLLLGQRNTQVESPSTHP